MKPDDKVVPPEGGQTTPVPPAPEGGQTLQEAPKQEVPKALEGKSPEDLVKMYGELEHKLGEQGHELGQLRQFQQDAALVLSAIQASPEAKKLIEGELVKMTGQQPASGESAQAPKQETPKVDDTRRAIEGQIIREFEKDVGLDAVAPEQKVQIYKAIGDELAEMLNPGGNKTYNEILDTIELPKLRPMLERAHYLAQRNEVVKKAMEEGMVKAKQNQAATIGSIPSSGSVPGTEPELTGEQMDVARKLGISDEDYKKYGKSTEKPEEKK